MKQVQPEVGPPRGTEDPSVALVTEAEDLWWVATASGGQIEQSAGDLVTWDGSDAIGETLRFVFEQRIFVGDETTFSYTPTASNPFRSKRLKRAHALPPPNDEAGYGYTLTVGGDPAESPSEAADDEGEGREPDLRVRPRIRVRDVEILPIAAELAPAASSVLEKHASASNPGGFWKVGNLEDSEHLKTSANSYVAWHSRETQALRFRFVFNPPIFKPSEKLPKTDPNNMSFVLSANAPPLLLELLPGVIPQDCCYDLEINAGAAENPWLPVWGPSAGKSTCDSGGTGGIYNVQPPPGGVRPRIRVQGVVITPGG